MAMTGYVHRTSRPNLHHRV